MATQQVLDGPEIPFVRSQEERVQTALRKEVPLDWVSPAGSASLSMSGRAGESLDESLPVPARFSSRLDTRRPFNFRRLPGPAEPVGYRIVPELSTLPKVNLLLIALLNFLPLTVLSKPGPRRVAAVRRRAGGEEWSDNLLWVENDAYH